ncbi:MAG: PepSY domain-containing protein [Gemmatimonadota bacterium]
MDESETKEHRPSPRASGRGPTNPATRTVARWMFHGHLWLGVVLSGLLLILGITGILLNHKRALGLMPDVPHEATGPLDRALPLAELVRLAGEAAPLAMAAGVDRLDVRPGDGLMKVRFSDDVVTEVTIDLIDGRILDMGERNDVFLEKLHSGEIFGDGWVLLSDFAAVVLIVLVVSGYWLWLFPRTRQ